MTTGDCGPADVEAMEAIKDVAARWTRAMEAGDAAALGHLMTDDIVVIHGDGRVLSGREAVAGDFVRAFASLRVSQTVESEETVLAGDWAFDRATVSSAVRPHGEAAARQFRSRTLTILRRRGAEGWRVARAIGVVVTGSHPPR